MKFEDLNTFNGSSPYVVPNEEPLVFREFLKDQHIGRAAGICSAGEVGLFGILPSVRQDLTLVDHSYGSLMVAMIKVLMIKKYGWEKTAQAIIDSDKGVLKNLVEKEVKNLPKELRKFKVPNFTYSRYNYEKNRYDEVCPNPELQGMWKTIPDAIIKRASEKLDLVSFLHGDLTDLIERGPFDLVYISNAFGHHDRTRQAPRHAEIEQIVKPKGLIIGCDTYGKMGPKWKKIKESRGNKSMWSYVLYQVPA